MELQELTNLISIRKYLSDTMGNPNFNRTIVNDMNNTLILIDKKIVSILVSSDFREYINYSDVKKAVKNVADINNIYKNT